LNGLRNSLSPKQQHTRLPGRHGCYSRNAKAPGPRPAGRAQDVPVTNEYAVVTARPIGPRASECVHRAPSALASGLQLLLHRRNEASLCVLDRLPVRFWA
jgi:hypothetical protein